MRGTWVAKLVWLTIECRKGVRSLNRGSSCVSRSSAQDKPDKEHPRAGDARGELVKLVSCVDNLGYIYTETLMHSTVHVLMYKSSLYR
jgi:hypothetical protein